MTDIKDHQETPTTADSTTSSPTEASPPDAHLAAAAASPAHATDDDADAGDESGPTDASEDAALVDESAWEEGDDDGEDDEPPMHLGAVAHESAAEVQASVESVKLSEQAEIPLDKIDADALWVVRRLRAKGYEAYLTGGCVRDLLIGRTPKDFDVATAAHPNQVRAEFRNCRLVGRRFRLAHVWFPNGKVIETATFRANPIDELDDLPQDLLVDRDNVFGNVEQDARRRDLTINGLFYDPVAGRVLDFVDGRKDLDARLIRTIGDPDVRFQEDPVRILRAIKFATRLGFEIEAGTWAAMCRHVGGLVRCAPARLQEELMRLLTSKHAAQSMEFCERVGVLRVIVPELAEAFDLPLEGRRVDAPRPAQPVAHEGTADVVPEAAASSTEPSADVPSSSDGVVPSEAAAAPGLATLPPRDVEDAPTVLLSVPSPEQRRARLVAVLSALDDAKKREADVTSAVAWAVLLTPVWEAFASSTSSFDAWWAEASERWTERLRFTRHDKERVPQLLQAQQDLEPARRFGHHARHVVSRPSFREALLVFTLRAWAAQEPLDDVAMWKVIAAASNQPYKQPRSDRPRQRAAGRHGGGGGHDRGGRGGRDRGGRDRGRRRRRG